MLRVSSFDQREIHRRIHALGLPASGVEVFEADGFNLGRDLDEPASLSESS